MFPWSHILFSSVFFSLCMCSPPNVHTRTHHAHDNNKERVEDAFDMHTKQASSQEFDDHKLDHEAILGSRQKVGEFDELSPEESKRRLAKLVEYMDTNHDGHVDNSELTQWVLKSFKSLAYEESQEMFSEEDVNDDGFITFEEYLKNNFDIDENSDEKNMLIEEDKLLWKAADLNNDGKLDVKEFAAFSSPQDFDHMHKTLIDQMFAQRDSNHDGFISFNEYIKDEDNEMPDPNGEYYISEKDKFDNVYDTNHDRMLDSNECVNWIVPNNTEIAQDEATHLITSADSNRDGLLTVKEIVDHHDVFVGSEATRYGEQLNSRAFDEL